jgi:nicotinate-nucleotide adenylyltransferase
MTRLGILGGTFDPIHLGHLEAASAARRSLSLDRIMLLPSRRPPHRSVVPKASDFHRFAMASLAVSELDAMVVSELELQREGPSYTSVTLERLHADGLQPSQLYFILGADAFAEIATWHAYPKLLELSNFAVISRPGFRSPDSGSAVPDTHSPGARGATGIYFVDAVTPDVSSTDIRRRVASGESIDGLVPHSVADHILRHRLYVPTPVAVL